MQTHKVLALITARGGSKGLPRKNVLLAAGKPLIAWSIEAACQASIVNRVVVSTDDNEIAEVSTAWGAEVPFRRPPSLANDTANSMDVVLHAIEQLPGFDYIVLLQPTSPLRTAADIESAFALLMASGASSCVSVSEAAQSPYWMYQLHAGNKLHPLLKLEPGITRRQDLPTAYTLNGAIYIAKTEHLLREKSFLGDGCVAYTMPQSRSIDIDTAEDFELFRLRVERQQT